MKSLFLTSNIGGIKKVDGNKKIPTSFFEKNNFVVNMKGCVESYEKFILVASDPYNYTQNDMFLDLDMKALEFSGLKFRENYILDYRNKDSVYEILKGGSLIFLSGGDTYQQNLFFNDINLKQYLENLDCCIVGISAGSINSANIVFNSPETLDQAKDPCILSGLGLCDINIEPHFYVKKENPFQINSILSESHNRIIYGLPDGTYILNNIIYGECYKIYKGKIKKICDDGKIFNIL